MLLVLFTRLLYTKHGAILFIYIIHITLSRVLMYILDAMFLLENKTTFNMTALSFSTNDNVI